MNKVLLVRPQPPKETIGLKHVMICEPLELEYLISNLREDLMASYELVLVDMLIDNRSLMSHVKMHQPRCVIFTGYNTHVNKIKMYAQQVKKYNKDIVTAVGGVHVEVVPEDFDDVHIDIRFWKNGIDAFNDLLNGLLTSQSLTSIQQIIDAYQRKTQFDYLPPNRTQNKNDRSKYFYMFHDPCALMKTSFGCPFQCAFCFCHEITDGMYYERSINDVIEELISIDEPAIYIVDDNFLCSEKRVQTFIDALKAHQLNKEFLIYGRADFIAAHPKIMADFKSVGLHGVIVGIESVREKDLESYNKRTTVDMNEKAISILNDLDIECYATLIIPLDFSKKDFKDLKRWLRKNSVYFVNLQPLTPLKGTGIYENYEPYFIEDPNDVALWDMAHIVLKPTHMSKRQFYYRILKLYYEIVMPPKHLIRLVKKFGFYANWRMLIGSSRVSLQYILKMIRG